MLYQLSYSRLDRSGVLAPLVVGRTGFEPVKS